MNKYKNILTLMRTEIQIFNCQTCNKTISIIHLFCHGGIFITTFLVAFSSIFHFNVWNKEVLQWIWPHIYFDNFCNIILYWVSIGTKPRKECPYFFLLSFSCGGSDSLGCFGSQIISFFPQYWSTR